MHGTAEKVMAEFPRLANEHASRAASFWAQGYYVIAPGRRLSADEIARFVDYERGEQGINPPANTQTNTPRPPAPPRR